MKKEESKFEMNPYVALALVNYLRAYVHANKKNFIGFSEEDLMIVASF